jgi:HAL2 family 3'(2'),5'-bisphosphate nucleotidase
MLNLDLPEIQFALHSVRQASLLVRQVQAEMVTPALTKNDRSPVTVADFASQALVGHLLAETHPEELLVAEEDSATLRAPDGTQTLEQVTHFVSRFAPQAIPQTVCKWIDHGRVDTADRFWTLDPIDGTKGFLRGDQYVVALALVVNGQVQIGILGCPNLINAHRPQIGGQGSLVIAVRGQGTWTTPLLPVESMSQKLPFEQLHVSSQSRAGNARILRSFEAGHTNIDQIDIFTHKLGVQATPVLMDSQAKYAVMAAGKGDLLLRLLSPDKPDYREKIWDQAAGSLVLEEAGGRITDLSGKALDFTTGRELKNNRVVLSSNGHLHTAALQALQSIGA